MADAPANLTTRLLRDIRMLLGLSPSTWLDLLHAIFELGIARYRLGTQPPKHLLQRARQLGQPTTMPPREASAIAARVAFAIPRVAARLPWRADCFI